MAEAVLVWLQQIAWRFGHILVGWRNVCQGNRSLTGVLLRSCECQDNRP